MSEIVDDKSKHCIPFILERLERHNLRYQDTENPPPFFLGLNGVQGAGKTVLVSLIKKTLEEPPHNLPTVVFSLDDLYMTHAQQKTLAQSHPYNPLWQHRGQPGTHDIALAQSIFTSLKRNDPTGIPQYNKAAFNGAGDRVPEVEWEKVNQGYGPGRKVIKVVLFEGWCVGFRALSTLELRGLWQKANNLRDFHFYQGRLAYTNWESVVEVNEALKSYDVLTNQLSALIHIDAQDLQYVYRWRLQQEQQLRATKGSGMTDEEVKHFIDGYYPAYELYTESLRRGAFRENVDQLWLVLDENRKVIKVQRV